jgi:hypothetical protein
MRSPLPAAVARASGCLHQLGAHDAAFGLGVVGRPGGQDSQQLLGGSPARAHQVHITELVLVLPVFGAKLGQHIVVGVGHAGLLAGRRGVVHAPADAGVALERGVDLGVW